MATPTAQLNPAATSIWHVGDRIRKIRELTGYINAKTEFAAKAGIDRGALATYETGAVTPRRGALAAISLHTGARLEWLETGEGAMWTQDGPKRRTKDYGGRPSTLANVTSLVGRHRKPRTPQRTLRPGPPARIGLA